MLSYIRMRQYDCPCSMWVVARHSKPVIDYIFQTLLYPHVVTELVLISGMGADVM